MAAGTVILFGVLGWAALVYGGVSNALLAFRGVVVAATVVGDQPSTVLAGGIATVSVQLRNLTGKEVVIHGTKLSCSTCMAVDGLPVALLPYGVIELPVQVQATLDDVGKTIQRTVEFYTAPSGHSVVLLVRASVSSGSVAQSVLINGPASQQVDPSDFGE